MSEQTKDPVVECINGLIASISQDQKEVRLPHIPSREELLNTHIAFIKTLLIVK